MNRVLHPCVTDPVQPDPVQPDPVHFFPSPCKNLASPVPGEIFSFIRPVCGFPSATFTYTAYIICVCLKKDKQRPDRKRQTGGKFTDRVTFFSGNPMRI